MVGAGAMVGPLGYTCPGTFAQMGSSYVLRVCVVAGLCGWPQEGRGTRCVKHFAVISWLSSWRHSAGWYIFFPLATLSR